MIKNIYYILKNNNIFLYYNMPYRRKSRYSRSSAASVIQLMYRRRRRRRRAPRRSRPVKQRYNSVKNLQYSRLGKTRSKLTLRKRVSALEVSSKHHHDKVSNTPEIITWNGTLLNNSRASYTGLLAIQGPKSDNTFETDSKLSEDETRTNDEIFCKSVRIRGLVKGIRPKDTLAPTDLATMNSATAQLMRNLCHSRIWITLLVDKRPFKMSATGEAEVNPLPLSTVGHTAIEEPYQNSPPTFLSSQLQFFGPEVSLRSYETGNRFKILSQQCITTSFENPSKFFDISCKINRKLKYVAARVAAAGQPAPANPPTVPYNYNLLVFMTSVVQTAVPAWSTLVTQSPSLTLKSSRCYFINS